MIIQILQLFTGLKYSLFIAQLYFLVQTTPMQNTGKVDDPIELDEDQTQVVQKQQQRKLQYQQNRHSIYKAHMSSDFDVMIAVIKADIQGTQQQKNNILAKRIKKFFSSEVKTINPQYDYFRKRRQPDYSKSQTQTIPNQLILYGIDFLSTRQIKAKFKDLQIEIKWLDDSHCKITFQNAEQAKTGLMMNLSDCPENKVKIQNQQMQVPKGWFKFHPYYYLTFERKLECRYANTNDNDAEINRSNQYFMMQEAKRQFENSIRSQFTQIRYLNVMRRFNFIDENKYQERVRNSNRQNGFNKGGRRENMRSRNQYHNQNRNNFNRNNNYRRNNNRYEQSQQQQIFQRSRNKQNENSKKQLDNISIISVPRSNASKRSNGSKLSLSICSNKGKAKDQQQEDDNKSNLSFLLNKSEISNGRAQMMAKELNNLNFDSYSIPDCQPVKKQIQAPSQDLSFVSNKSSSKHNKNKNSQLNLSVELSKSQTFAEKDMKKKQNMSVSLIDICQD